MSKRRKHNDLWVTRDGVVGWGEITLFDTSLWSEEDFALIDSARRKDVYKLAKWISRKYEGSGRGEAERAFDALFEDTLRQLRNLDVRAFVIDEDGVTEIDPDTEKPI